MVCGQQKRLEGVLFRWDNPSKVCVYLRVRFEDLYKQITTSLVNISTVHNSYANFIKLNFMHLFTKDRIFI